MAVTKIWAVKGNVANPIRYIENPEKTANDTQVATGDALETLLDYAANGDKTMKKFYVSGINCNTSVATRQFRMTQERFDKTDGNVCYHAYQSFEEEEVSPDLAHRIGVELAEKMWGDRFQVVVTTHLNTEHIHNHFVINSVSFKDGKKLHDNRKHYEKLRKLSDRLCQEHGLSVIEHPEGGGKSHYAVMMDKAGMPTRYSVARESIDAALSVSVNMEEFKAELARMGYRFQFNPKRKYWTITIPDWSKPIRLYQLGKDYTNERIMERLYENDATVRQGRHQPNAYRLPKRIDKINRRKTGLERMYLRCCYELGYLPKRVQNPARVHKVFKEELLMCDKYSRQARLLGERDIVTEEDLLRHMDKVGREMTAIGSERDELRKKIKRAIPEEEREDARNRITELTAKLKDLRSEKKLCEDIKDRSGMLAEKLAAVDQDRSIGKEVRKR